MQVPIVQSAPSYQTPAEDGPGYPAAHGFLVLALVITVIMGILNPLSLAFGIPAVILAVLVSSYTGVYIYI